MEGHVSCGAYKKKPTPNANYGDENCYRAYSHQGCRTVIEATAGNKQLLEVRRFKHSQKRPINCEQVWHEPVFP